LVGEQGSAKSSTQKILRQLIDPNLADLRAAPKSVEDLWISARNSHFVSLENVSNLQSTYQDALCVLATGGGHSTRKLYTNTEESILELRKPIVLNGIASNVTAQDLVDRSVRVDLPTIKARELHSEHMARVEATLPALLGGLLNLFAKVLATLPSVSVNVAELPRMADFAKLGEAVARVYGHSPGTFLRIYNSKRRDSVLATIDAFPVGAALLALLETMSSGYKGTLGDLLKLLEIHTSTREGFPKTPKRLGDMLRRLAPALRVFGYECEPLPKTGGKIQWNIFPKGHRAEQSPASPTSPDPFAGHTGLAGHAPHWAEFVKQMPRSAQKDANGKAA
jgi:hypothetical protein